MHFGPLSWVDPLAMWHNEKSTFGYADGHSEMNRWYDKSFIDWSQRAMFTPMSFSFYMTPPANEQGDIQFMGRGFPCKSHN
jgi:prepilin-type processing-associated H-X9-DG protein